jgi:hypothetical protein
MLRNAGPSNLPSSTVAFLLFSAQIRQLGESIVSSFLMTRRSSSTVIWQGKLPVQRIRNVLMWMASFSEIEVKLAAETLLARKWLTKEQILQLQWTR